MLSSIFVCALAIVFTLTKATGSPPTCVLKTEIPEEGYFTFYSNDKINITLEASTTNNNNDSTPSLYIGTSTTLPDGATVTPLGNINNIIPVTISFIWQPNELQTGTYMIVINIIDNNNDLSDTCSFTIHIHNNNDTGNLNEAIVTDSNTKVDNGTNLLQLSIDFYHQIMKQPWWVIMLIGIAVFTVIISFLYMIYRIIRILSLVCCGKCCARLCCCGRCCCSCFGCSNDVRFIIKDVTNENIHDIEDIHLKNFALEPMNLNIDNIHLVSNSMAVGETNMLLKGKNNNKNSNKNGKNKKNKNKKNKPRMMNLESNVQMPGFSKSYATDWEKYGAWRMDNPEFEDGYDSNNDIALPVFDPRMSNIMRDDIDELNNGKNKSKKNVFGFRRNRKNSSSQDSKDSKDSKGSNKSNKSKSYKSKKRSVTNTPVPNSGKYTPTLSGMRMDTREIISVNEDSKMKESKIMDIIDLNNSHIMHDIDTRNNLQTIELDNDDEEMDALLKSLESLETKSKRSTPKSSGNTWLNIANMITRPFGSRTDNESVASSKFDNNGNISNMDVYPSNNSDSNEDNRGNNSALLTPVKHTKQPSYIDKDFIIGDDNSESGDFDYEGEFLQAVTQQTIQQHLKNLNNLSKAIVIESTMDDESNGNSNNANGNGNGNLSSLSSRDNSANSNNQTSSTGSGSGNNIVNNSNNKRRKSKSQSCQSQSIDTMVYNMSKHDNTDGSSMDSSADIENENDGIVWCSDTGRETSHSMQPQPSIFNQTNANATDNIDTNGNIGHLDTGDDEDDDDHTSSNDSSSLTGPETQVDGINNVELLDNLIQFSSVIDNDADTDGNGNNSDANNNRGNGNNSGYNSGNNSDCDASKKDFVFKLAPPPNDDSGLNNASNVSNDDENMTEEDEIILSSNFDRFGDTIATMSHRDSVRSVHSVQSANGIYDGNSSMILTENALSKHNSVNIINHLNNNNKNKNNKGKKRKNKNRSKNKDKKNKQKGSNFQMFGNLKRPSLSKMSLSNVSEL